MCMCLCVLYVNAFVCVQIVYFMCTLCKHVIFVFHVDVHLIVYSHVTQSTLVSFCIEYTGLILYSIVVLCISYIVYSYCTYGVATISSLLTIIGLLCRIWSLLQGSFAKETYHFKEPTNRSHPIVHSHVTQSTLSHVTQSTLVACHIVYSHVT